MRGGGERSGRGGERWEWGGERERGPGKKSRRGVGRFRPVREGKVWLCLDGLLKTIPLRVMATLPTHPCCLTLSQAFTTHHLFPCHPFPAYNDTGLLSPAFPSSTIYSLPIVVFTKLLPI